jgi:hypothetical protein
MCMDLWSLLELSFNDWMVILATSESPFRPFWRVERERQKQRVVSENVRAIYIHHIFTTILSFTLRDPRCLFIIIIIIIF